MISASIDENLSIKSLYFVIESRTLMVLCEDFRNTQQFLKCQWENEKNCLQFTRFNKEKHLKRVICCEMVKRADGHSAILIGNILFHWTELAVMFVKQFFSGTVIGNIYAMDVQNMELAEYIVFLDSALKELKANPLKFLLLFVNSFKVSNLAISKIAHLTPFALTRRMNLESICFSTIPPLFYMTLFVTKLWKFTISNSVLRSEFSI